MNKTVVTVRPKHEKSAELGKDKLLKIVEELHL
jgi:hypothetical protein